MEEQYIEIDKDGNKCYYKDKAMTIGHRLDGPAVEWADGGKAWWVDDKCHRLDGPAIEYADGSKEWWVDGKLHRLDALSKPLELTLDQIAAKFGVDESKIKIVK